MNEEEEIDISKLRKVHARCGLHLWKLWVKCFPKEVTTVDKDYAIRDYVTLIKCCCIWRLQHKRDREYKAVLN